MNKIKALISRWFPEPCDYTPIGANPTLRHLPTRLAEEFRLINDPYIHQLINHLNTAIDDLYIINADLNCKELDELLRRRFPL